MDIKVMKLHKANLIIINLMEKINWGILFGMNGDIKLAISVALSGHLIEYGKAVDYRSYSTGLWTNGIKRIFRDALLCM